MMAKPLAVLILAGAMSNGCTEATSPNHFNTGIRVEVLVPLRAVGVQDNEVAVLPAVRVLDAVTQAPVAGKVFTFTLASSIGTTEIVSVTTGSNGVATLPRWRLGSALGRYTATGVTDGWGPIIFSVMVPGKMVAIYDLVSINGSPLPYGASWLERHYVLYETGLFNRFINVPATSFQYSEVLMGTYRRIGNDRIEFTMDGINHDGNTGRLSMAVLDSQLVNDESDNFFGWVEVYALRGP
jgi:hypothetical protein